ncbi:hypothetical protein A3216_11185 [Mycobacterium leprae 7935681]|nr:hypothetical protein A3216_11185 [Mycobacterium leprae 7935681]
MRVLHGYRPLTSNDAQEQDSSSQIKEFEPKLFPALIELYMSFGAKALTIGRPYLGVRVGPSSPQCNA